MQLRNGGVAVCGLVCAGHAGAGAGEIMVSGGLHAYLG
jgi:hypothetical protein